MIEPILSYVRLLRFTGPELAKRYYRLFGDLEYDLLALHAEAEVMRLRLREIKRRAHSCVGVSKEEERQINAVSHELADHHYTRIDALRAQLKQARAFQYDHVREREGYYLLSDITTAIMGVDNDSIRGRERETLTIACEAYGKLDLSALIDIHDSVQNLLALPRRDQLDPQEQQEWLGKLESLRTSAPLCHTASMKNAERIANRMLMLKRKIAREQANVERLGLIYWAAACALRHLN